MLTELRSVESEQNSERSGVYGSLGLRFRRARETGPTRLLVEEQVPPLRVVRAFAGDDEMAVVHLHNISGGVLGGDQLHLAAQLEAGSQAQLTTTGSTRVYRQREGYGPAVQSNRFSVGPGALLEYLPDSLIPYADSHFRQMTRIDLAGDAGLFYWEVLAPGRTARGEEFAYAGLEMELEIYGAGEPIVLERLRWQPERHDLRSPARLGEYGYYAVFYACRVGVAEERWLALEGELRGLADELSRPGEALWGVSTLPAHGLSVRVLSKNNRAIPPGLVRFWQELKRKLYGREAVPPRKVY